jgi:hypothetical protein
VSILVTVHISNSIETARRIREEHPELARQLGELHKKHGGLGHRRLHRDDEILDLDEWESEDGFRAFLAEAQPIIGELSRLRGDREPPADRIWSIEP